jgi:hypothetical protein
MYQKTKFDLPFCGLQAEIYIQLVINLLSMNFQEKLVKLNLLVA